MGWLTYKRNAKQAVDSLTFGVKKSECFGLLGKFKPETNKIFSKQFASVPQIRFENPLSDYYRIPHVSGGVLFNPLSRHPLTLEYPSDNPAHYVLLDNLAVRKICYIDTIMPEYRNANAMASAPRDAYVTR